MGLAGLGAELDWAGTAEGVGLAGGGWAGLGLGWGWDWAGMERAGWLCLGLAPGWAGLGFGLGAGWAGAA